LLVLQNVDTDSGTHPESCFSRFWVFPGVKRLGFEADHSPGSSVKGKNEWSYTSTPLICLHGMDVGKLYVYSHYHRSWPRSPTYDGENMRAFIFVFYKCRYSAELPFRSTLFRPGEAAVAVLQIGRSLVRFQIVIGIFLLTSFRSHCGPGVD